MIPQLLPPTRAPGPALSDIAASLGGSAFRDMTAECEAMGGINLALGVCDTDVAPAIRDAARRAIDHGPNHCTDASGLRELRTLVSDGIRRRSGLHYEPDSEVVITSGATGALYCACLALLNPGDEVVLFEPGYPYHELALRIAGAVPIRVPAGGDLRAAIGPRTRAILINTPSNPSGRVWSRAELETVAAVATSHDLFVLTDEVYEHFVYEGEHLSPAAVPGLRERTVVTSGFSKLCAVTGWRVGYTACDRRWAEAIARVQDVLYICAPTPLQRGLARALSNGALDPDHLRATFRARRDRLCHALDRAGLAPRVPQGGHFVLADLSSLAGNDAAERARSLLRLTGIATVPGDVFFPSGGGEHLARFCFAKNDPILDEACRRLDRLGSGA